VSASLVHSVKVANGLDCIDACLFWRFVSVFWFFAHGVRSAFCGPDSRFARRFG
jgi:hypothetical protein